MCEDRSNLNWGQTSKHRTWQDWPSSAPTACQTWTVCDSFNPYGIQSMEIWNSMKHSPLQCTERNGSTLIDLSRTQEAMIKTTPSNFLIFNALFDNWKFKREKKVESSPNWLVSQSLGTNMKLTGMSATGYKYGHEKWKCVTSVRPSSLTQMRGIWRCSRALNLPE